MMIELLQDVADYGDAPSFTATYVWRHVLISPNIVRIAFARDDARSDGRPEKRASGFVDVDLGRAEQINAANNQAIAQLLRAYPQVPVIGMAQKSH